MRLIFAGLATLAGLCNAAPAASQAELDALDDTLGSVLQALNDMWDLRHITKENAPQVSGDDHDQLLLDLADKCGGSKNCHPVNDDAFENLQKIGLTHAQALEVLQVVLDQGDDDDSDASQPQKDDAKQHALPPAPPGFDKPDSKPNPLPQVPHTPLPQPEDQPEDNPQTPVKPQPKPKDPPTVDWQDLGFKPIAPQVQLGPQIQLASICSNPFGCRDGQ